MRTTLIYLSALFGLLLTSCGDSNAAVESAQTEAPAPDAHLPTDLKLVLDAHGGLGNWQAFRQLSYEMPRGDAAEYQLVDLHDRREYIRQPAGDGGEDIEMGYDGQDIWITADTSYRGNPVFYKNLMFYFYAMPWVLADDGINYTTAEPLTVGDKTYDGVFISYDTGVGYSPTDNYILYYDPATKKMRWLAYTVTGDSGETSEDFRFIEYPTWTNYGGVELPDSLVWYTVEEGVPTAARNTRVFSDVKLDKEPAADEVFARREGSRSVDL